MPRRPAFGERLGAAVAIYGRAGTTTSGGTPTVAASPTSGRTTNGCRSRATRRTSSRRRRWTSSAGTPVPRSLAMSRSTRRTGPSSGRAYRASRSGTRASCSRPTIRRAPGPTTRRWSSGSTAAWGRSSPGWSGTDSRGTRRRRVPGGDRGGGGGWGRVRCSARFRRECGRDVGREYPWHRRDAGRGVADWREPAMSLRCSPARACLSFRRADVGVSTAPWRGARGAISSPARPITVRPQPHAYQDRRCT